MPRFWLILFMLLVVGCASLPQSPSLLRTPAASPTDISSLPAATVTPAPETANCAFVWSTRSLPEVSRQLTVALREQNMPEAEVEATAYGEDCIDPATNEVVRFAAMQTDFFFAVVVPDIGDREQMGSWIERIYRVLEAFPPGGELPGPNPGYIGITFSSGRDSVSLWFRRAHGELALAEGLRGSALFELLSTLQ